MAEEQRLEGHRLCANNCGFFGTPATRNLCSKCYRDSRLDEDRGSALKITVERSLGTVAVAAAPTATVPADIGSLLAGPVRGEGGLTRSAAAASRCLACRKRVGLTGFVCRCGETFCGAHRYPERHTCGYDFKREGKEAIARANPVVRAEKLQKI